MYTSNVRHAESIYNASSTRGTIVELKWPPVLPLQSLANRLPLPAHHEIFPAPLLVGPVRGKVTAGGFRMKSIRIGCIEISDESLRSPGEGPEGKGHVAMILSKHVLSSTCGASE
jgi:hypothetical protein